MGFCKRLRGSRWGWVVDDASHLWEEEDFLDRGLIGHDHGESVDADTESYGGWHAIGEGADEVFV